VHNRRTSCFGTKRFIFSTFIVIMLNCWPSLYSSIRQNGQGPHMKQTLRLFNSYTSLKKLTPSCVPNVQKFREPQPAVALRACPGLHRDCFLYEIRSFTAIFIAAPTRHSSKSRDPNLTFFKLRVIDIPPHGRFQQNTWAIQ
jgi:hypothetical protein